VSEEAIRLIEKQQRWEIESVDRGVRRYREMLAKATENDAEADLPPGQKMMVAIIKELVPAIRELQETAAERWRNGERPFSWGMQIMCLEAEKIAVIAARTALSFSRQERLVPQLAVAIANRIREQRNFELWQDVEREKVKKAKEAGTSAVNLVDVMKRSVKAVDARTVRKWIKKAEDFDKVEWTTEEKIHLGVLIVRLLAERGGGWFEIRNVSSHNKGRITTEQRLVLSDAAREFIAYHHAQSELTRPWLLPMLCPPNPWRFVQSKGATP
jgi:hypothetical protein